MKTFAVISRHAPTASQINVAEEQGIALVPVGDVDAFTIEEGELGDLLEGYNGVVVAHAALALRCSRIGLEVGVFQNLNRAALGAPPQFEAGRLAVFPPSGIVGWSLGESASYGSDWRKTLPMEQSVK